MANKAKTKSQLRGEIFAAENRKLKRKTVSFLGVEIEIQQPSLSNIVDMFQTDNNTIGLVNTLIDYAYVPGTDEKIFEEADRDQLASMPYSKSFQEVLDAIQELSDIDIEAAAKN